MAASPEAQSVAGLRVLLVEDNRDIAASVCRSLERAGHVVDYAESSEQALEILGGSSVDLLVIDVMLPKMDGIALTRAIRTRKLTGNPILMLTARDAVEDKLAAFDAGADDYLTKPFEMPELIARCDVLTRRGRLNEGANFDVGDLSINPDTFEVMRAGDTLKLTPIGFQILLTLARAAPAVVLRDDLEHAIWGLDRPDSDAIRTHMSVLRAAVDRPYGTALIETVHGAGWRLAGTPG